MDKQKATRWTTPFSFNWGVSEFELARAVEEVDVNPPGRKMSKPPRLMVETKPIGIATRRAYFPLLDRTGLFKTFVDFEPTDDNILKFANTYGPLQGKSPHSLARTVVRGKPGALYYAESPDDWREQIAQMKRLVRTWGAIQEEDQPFLKGLIRWNSDCVTAHWDARHHRELAVIARSTDQVWATLRPADLMGPAKLYLQRAINDQLEKFPSQIRMLRENGDIVLSVFPTSLLAALWFQFARAVDGERNYHLCLQCRRWFEVGGGGSRTDAEFCGPACKQKAYRARKGKTR